YALPLAWGSDDITAYRACERKGMAHTNRPVFNYRSNGLSITSTGNDLEKMRANLLYAAWLRDSLANHTPHGTELVVYRNLLEQQDRLMLQRKQYTMAPSMRSNRMRRFWQWYKHRKQFGLRLRDIFVAAGKGGGLRKRVSNGRVMDIIFHPPANEENRYINLLVRELRAKGYRIHPLD